jgi:hypothetical protein
MRRTLESLLQEMPRSEASMEKVEGYSFCVVVVIDVMRPHALWSYTIVVAAHRRRSVDVYGLDGVEHYVTALARE